VIKRMLLLAGTLAAATALSAQPAAATSLAPALMNLRAATAHDRVYTASTGETVRISVSDQLVPNEEENQGWAEFLASEPHSTELGKVLLYIAPRSEVRQLCGRAALACYYGESQRIVLPAEERASPPSRKSILAHEYGHHIARNRENDPWPALAFGTKRWATYTKVCSGLRSGRLSLREYELSPSETFAESYRVLVERRLGLEASPWEIIHPSLQPDDTALSLLEQDVLDPWLGNTVVTFKGTRTRSVRVATPLDGKVTMTLRGPRSAVYELRLPGQPTKRARGQGRVRSSATVCGLRQVTATVRRISGRGPFQLVVSRP
jgi:hypothetical protein